MAQLHDFGLDLRVVRFDLRESIIPGFDSLLFS